MLRNLSSTSYVLALVAGRQDCILSAALFTDATNVSQQLSSQKFCSPRL